MLFFIGSGSIVVTTIPGAIVIVTSTVTVPPSPSTIVEGGSTVITTVPGSTTVVTSGISQPAITTTITVPPGGTTIAFTAPGDTSAFTSLLTSPAPVTLIDEGTTLTSFGPDASTAVPLTSIEPSTTTTVTGSGSATVSTVSALPSLRVCAKRFVNPTYTAPGPLPTDYTWGCAPGFLCVPPKIDCDIEEGFPDRGYYCAPSECKPVEPLKPPQYWGTPIIANETDSYYVQGDYFNLNPRNFNLDYNIFVEETDLVVAPQDIANGPTSIYRDAVAESTQYPRAIKRQESSTKAPAVCFEDCSMYSRFSRSSSFADVSSDACGLEAESTGKSPELCEPDSVFTAAVEGCQECITRFASRRSAAYRDSVQPDFQQWLDYCSGSDVGSTAPSSAEAQNEGDTATVTEPAEDAASAVTETGLVSLLTSDGSDSSAVTAAAQSTTPAAASSAPTDASSADNPPSGAASTGTSSVDDASGGAASTGASSVDDASGGAASTGASSAGASSTGAGSGDAVSSGVPESIASSGDAAGAAPTGDVPSSVTGSATGTAPPSAPDATFTASGSHVQPALSSLFVLVGAWLLTLLSGNLAIL
ncbi:MAG: hypothetical protein M1837_001671 [Sclerophora amabilis]|nr:MAG: hypothetical protein M1837_001671 [Sclerophora amabilis]